MKLSDYRKTNSPFTEENILRIQIYENFIRTEKKIVYLEITQDLLDRKTFSEILADYKNSVICITNLDIDIPPPKKPYTYDQYWRKYAIPNDYESVPYGEKIELSMLETLEKQNLHLFCHAVSINHPRITMIPGGIFSRFHHFQFHSLEKTILCYANFGLSSVERWFGDPRRKIAEWIRTNCPFMLIENVVDHSVRQEENVTHFYMQLARSKFSICPRGCGLDSYRIWDSIVLGCIPIVERFGGYEQFTDLPIYFVDSIEEYGKLTETELQNVWEEYQNRNFNYHKLHMKYWIDLIQQKVAEYSHRPQNHTIV